MSSADEFREVVEARIPSLPNRVDSFDHSAMERKEWYAKSTQGEIHNSRNGGGTIPRVNNVSPPPTESLH